MSNVLAAAAAGWALGLTQEIATAVKTLVSNCLDPPPFLPPRTVKRNANMAAVKK